MNTVPDGAVAVTISLAARRGGLPACGDRPSILFFVNGTIVRYSVNSNCYSLAKERIQVQIKDIIDMPDGEFENLVERLFNEAKKNLL